MATSRPRNRETISLKLLVDGDSNRVVFAEAGKEFVDFLFGLLHIPIGSIMGLLRTHGVAGSGSFGRVYQSIQTLDPSYLLQSKETLLMPIPAFPSQTRTPPFLQNFGLPAGDQSSSLFKSKINFDASLNYGKQSLPFTDVMSCSGPFLGNEVVAKQETKETGFVRGGMLYMVMDDLRVKPASTISSITLLNSFNVKDVGSLQEKMVSVDIKKGLELVTASFGSATVLTDVFLRKNVLGERRQL